MRHDTFPPKKEPKAPCGLNPWYCPYDPIDPNCCQSKEFRKPLDTEEIEELINDSPGG